MIDRSFHQHIQQIQQWWMMMMMTTLMCSSVSIVGIILVLSQTAETMSKRPTWQRAKHFCEEPQTTLIWENSIQPQEFDHASTASKPQTFICIPQGCPACCSTRLLSVAILSHRSIQHVAYRKLPQRSPTGGITTQHLSGPAAWLCPHTWQIAWCQSSPSNSQAVSRFTKGNYCIYIKSSPSHHHTISWYWTRICLKTGYPIPSTG